MPRPAATRYGTNTEIGCFATSCSSQAIEAYATRNDTTMPTAIWPRPTTAVSTSLSS